MDSRSLPQCQLSNDAAANINVDATMDVQCCTGPRFPLLVDIDALNDVPIPPPQASKELKQQCCGIQIDFPAGSSTHLSYPFSIHDELGDPWDYSVTKGIMVLRGKGCTMSATHRESGHCNSCKLLTENGNLQGVLWRIKSSVHKNTHLAYHSIGGLIAFG